MYDTPTLYTVSQSILGHFAFSPVNILAPAIVQLDNMPPSVIALLDRAIEWLHYDRSFATTRGLTSLLQLLLTHDRLGAMNPLWSRIGVVIPAIFQVVTTTTQQLDATTLAVLDAAVTLNFDGFVMALTADSDDLDLLCDEILERDSNGEPTLYVEIQHRLMVHTVEYLAQDPEHPRTLPYSTLQGLYRRCDSPDWAWVLAPLVLSLPEGNDQKLAFAHKCIDLLTRAVDDNPFVTNSHWRQAIEQLRNVV
ncbi:hypothetical protein SDRG_17082 [Saprolegnia diclina VS20]|uniref:Uncharacterized protein n=1 Tax=Saprolegnia diclina (strain VS20) TaxID=1156394 RepID=T0PVK5_SAPDV|nr:hypothetical protein SDRG_17082 [Saprolegnia diclina VS20]EQC25035.1 hypothetical protein SDRG_17082 [Saprolegnia diclina VS20]|eukprot:XP_008621539.1 hypothetical protein SDRG_17082 [Saprolegnia diclina VS20]